LTHSLIALAALIAAALVAGMVAYPIAAGYASHIAADMTTRNGVPLFYPVWRRSFHLLPPGFRLTTGGIIEGVFSFACTVGCLYLIAFFLDILPAALRI
jgi:membrane-bound metal-dependent hydrolase YbcI (DUF457 family)